MAQLEAEVEITLATRTQGNDESGGPEKFRGIVQTIDMSLCGLSASIISSSKDTATSFGPAMAYLLVGKEITVTFCSSFITVWGKVVRYDPKNMLIAVIVTKVSDIVQWRNLCSDAILSSAHV